MCPLSMKIVNSCIIIFFFYNVDDARLKCNKNIFVSLCYLISDKYLMFQDCIHNGFGCGEKACSVELI